MIQEFEDFMNDAYEEILMFDGITRPAGTVLRKVDPTSFRAEFLNWCDVMGFDIDEVD